MCYKLSSSLWPDDICNGNSGFSDEQLTQIASRKFTKKFDKRYGSKQVPPLFWTTELYSFGKCYREVYGWPWYLPIPVYGDHGVSMAGKMQEHEISNASHYHLTWYKDRFESLCRNYSNKTILRVTHPWVAYRHKLGISQKKNSEGTIVFYSHSNSGIEIEDYDNDEYFSKLKSLPSEFHPIYICLHMHDIDKGLHLHLRKYGLPVVTMGNTSSFFFVDRFYNMISNFKYASSASGGSDLYLCHEFGLDYFIFGEKPNYINYSNSQNPLGPLTRRYDDLFTRTQKEKREKFLMKEDFSFAPRHERDSLVMRALCVGEGSGNELKDIFKKEVMKFVPLYLKSIVIMCIKKLVVTK